MKFTDEVRKTHNKIAHEYMSMVEKARVRQYKYGRCHKADYWWCTTSRDDDNHELFSEGYETPTIDDVSDALKRCHDAGLVFVFEGRIDMYDTVEDYENGGPIAAHGHQMGDDWYVTGVPMASDYKGEAS